MNSSSENFVELALPNFNTIQELHNGKFGRVLVVQEKTNDEKYVIKFLRKFDHQRQRISQAENLEKELDFLTSLRHPFIIQLDFHLNTRTMVMIGIEYCSRGDLFSYLANGGSFDEEAARFYVAELVLAIEYMHSQGIMHRDLKPENILLHEDGHIKVCDFGLAKKGTFTSTSGAITNCGTEIYMAPEMFMTNGYGLSVDWWMLGMCAFEMMFGTPAHYIVQNRTLSTRHHKWILSNDSITELSRKFILDLLDKTPEKRLGYKGAEQVKQHDFFGGIDWEDVYEMNFIQPTDPHSGFVIEEETPLEF